MARLTGRGRVPDQVRLLREQQLKASPTYNLPGVNSGSGWANWSGVATLQHGGQYGICAQGQYSFPNDSLFFPDGPNSCSMGTMLGRRAYTTIDRSKPNAALQLAAGADYVKDTKVPVRIDFADDVAGPFPANFLCFQVGGGPQNLCDKNTGAIYGHNPACSVPGSAGKSTTFSCTADYGQVPDGNVWACVIAADASIPDNPNGPDQSATAEKANLSAASCDGVVVDRTPPTVAIGVASASVKVGELVSFAGLGLGRDLGPRRRRPVDVGRQHRGRHRRRRHAHLHAGGDLRGDAERRRRGRQHGDGEDDDHRDRRRRRRRPRRRRRRWHDDAAAPTAVAPRPRRRRHDPPGGGAGAAPATRPPSLELDAPRTARARAKSIPVELTASDAGRVQLSLLAATHDLPRQRQARRRRHRRPPPEAPRGHQGGPLHAQGGLHGRSRPRAA